jgi:hypothetical protein
MNDHCQQCGNEGGWQCIDCGRSNWDVNTMCYNCKKNKPEDMRNKLDMYKELKKLRLCNNELNKDNDKLKQINHDMKTEVSLMHKLLRDSHMEHRSRSPHKKHRSRSPHKEHRSRSQHKEHRSRSPHNKHMSHTPRYFRDGPLSGFREGPRGFREGPCGFRDGPSRDFRDDRKAEPCRFFKMGKCMNGIHCTFRH